MEKPPVYIPNLLKPNPSKPTIVAPNDPFISTAVLEKCSSVYSEEKDGTPKYMMKDKAFIEQLIDFPENFWDEIDRIQGKREAELLDAEAKVAKVATHKETEDLKIKHKLDTKVNQIMKSNRAVVKRSCPAKIPFKSTLTHDEHDAYIRAFIKFQIRPPNTSHEFAEHEYYLRLQNRVFQEQSCLMNFSYKVAQLQLNEYNKVPDVMEAYISNHVSHRCLRAQKYPPVYISENDIPIKPPDVKRTVTFNLNHVGHLLSLGYVPWVRIPNSNIITTLPLNETVFDSKNPYCDDLFDRREYIHKTPVSDDPNAELLAVEHTATVVMSASSFKTLSNNLESPYDKEWDIPVKIKAATTEGANGVAEVKRIVYIDKPLPRKSWFPLQKRSTFFKKAAICSLTRPNKDHFYKMAGPVFERRIPSPDVPLAPRPKSPAIYDDIFGVISDAADVENFGIESKSLKGILNPIPEVTTPHRRKKSKRKNKRKKVNDVEEANIATDVEEGDCLLDNILKDQRVMLKPSASQGSPTKGRVHQEADKKNEDGLFPWSNSLTTDWKGALVRRCPPNNGSNLHYQLFSFGKDTSDASKLKTHEEFRIIIRHNIHGLSRQRNKNFQPKAYVIHPKIENQAFFGCEVSTLTEITEQWASLVVRPNTSLLFLRTCTESGSVLLSEERTMQAVLKDGKQPHVNFQPQSALATIHAVLSLLTKMPSGDYLLHHSPKTEAFIKLMKEAPKPDGMSFHSLFNLHERYKDCLLKSGTYLTPPWLAIDTHVLTPFHMIHKKIPATFPMENAEQLSKDQRRKKKKFADVKKDVKDLQ